MKKTLVFILAAIMVLSLAACGGKKEEQETTAAQTEAEITTSEETTAEETTAAGGYIKSGTKGAGEETITSKYCTMTIPAGMEYEVDYSNQEDNSTGSFSLTLNKEGKHDMETFEISTTRMISNIDDAVKECERMNKFSDDAVIEYGDDVTYAGNTYKQVRITPNGGKTADFLVYYYKNFEGYDTYVEVKCTTDPFGNVIIPIDDPMIISMVESIQYR